MRLQLERIDVHPQRRLLFGVQRLIALGKLAGRNIDETAELGSRQAAAVLRGARRIDIASDARNAECCRQ
jgi:hypothetical protein